MYLDLNTNCPVFILLEAKVLVILLSYNDFFEIPNVIGCTNGLGYGYYLIAISNSKVIPFLYLV